MTEAKLQPLFKELDNFIKNEEFENICGICDKILAISPTDKDAIHCKLISLLQSSKFEEALQFLDNHHSLAKDFVFERACCYYKLKKYNEVKPLVESVAEPKPVKFLELEAQLCYSLEEYERAIEIFNRIIKEHNADSAEIITNLFASLVNAGRVTEGLKLIGEYKNIIQSSAECTYNVACIFLESGDFGMAENYLVTAQKLCKEILLEEGASEAEIQNEQAIMNTQLGFLYQLQNRTEAAMELYTNSLRAKPSDASVSAVASNNIVVVKKEHDLFDSFKKLKQATSQTLEQKLSSFQKKVIGFNHCLLLLYMNKADQCRELVKILQGQFPDEERFPLVLSALYHKEKKPTKCEDILRGFASQHPNSVRVQLSLAQLQMVKGNVAGTIETLENIKSLENKPGMVATLISLYEQLADVKGAAKTLDNYLSTWENLKGKDEEEFVAVLKASANFKLKHNKFKEAAELFERVLKINPNDLEALPGLVIAYSQVDPKLAEKYDARIPTLQGESEIDAEELENLPTPKLLVKSQSKKEEPDSTEKKEVHKKKRNKRKKPPPPKDPKQPVDPERWIPMRERSYYKRKLKKGQKLEKGAQGSVGIGKSVTVEKKLAEEKMILEGKQEKEETSAPASSTKQPQNKPKGGSQRSNKKKGQKKRR